MSTINQIDYSARLGIAVKNARTRLHLTQPDAAELASVSVHTISDIESAKANPSLAILGPLIEELKIDPSEIFNPEKVSYDPVSYSAHQLINTCSIEELEFILPITIKTLEMLRSDKFKSLTEQNDSTPSKK